MKKMLFGLMTTIALLAMMPITADAASINGSWSSSGIALFISGNHARVNGINVKLKKTGKNRWRSVINNSSQPFTLVKHGNHLLLSSGMDHEKLTR
ncbi:hypothetical protein MOO44_03615 [Nicoliella spurrieriana]|uniref:Uncharacterized protein n=1 Tax=Nicoliella spurrieriana TaxID=2925830 RepID=A0A976X6B5_9LACO|nr:hypothetical protein [Nicoliella spurrieriana]UQS87257.1 hypothetical protein MOO44_03615 [Nicoliella spurrieriana]